MTRMRNIAAKWIRLGLNKFSVRPLMHEALPGVIIQPAVKQGDELPINVIILDESTDVLITFESFEAARALCHSIMHAVHHGPPRPGASMLDMEAEAIIRSIERAILAAKTAGSLQTPDAYRRATHAENEAINLVLATFHSLPIHDDRLG